MEKINLKDIEKELIIRALDNSPLNVYVVRGKSLEEVQLLFDYNIDSASTTIDEVILISRKLRFRSLSSFFDFIQTGNPDAQVVVTQPTIPELLSIGCENNFCKQVIM